MDLCVCVLFALSLQCVERAHFNFSKYKNNETQIYHQKFDTKVYDDETRKLHNRIQENVTSIHITNFKLAVIQEKIASLFVTYCVTLRYIR